MAWIRWGPRVRPPVAVAAIALVVAVVAVWGSFGRGAASRRLLMPLIAYHKAQYDINRTLWQHDLDNARAAMDHVRRHFDNLRRIADDAFQTGISPHALVNTGHRGQFEARGLGEDFTQVGDRLRDATMHENMTLYHFHMKVYYEDLLERRAAWLPSLPESLVVERRMIELELQRRYGGYPDEREERGLLRRYGSEPPPHLGRRVPAPKP